MTNNIKKILFLVAAVACSIVLYNVVIAVLAYITTTPEDGGIVLDHDGRPVPGVIMNYEERDIRYVLPFRFYKAYIVKRRDSVTSGKDGSFTIDRRYKFITHNGISKPGYVCESQRPEYFSSSQKKTYFIYKVEKNKTKDILSGESDWCKLPNSTSVYADIESGTYSASQKPESDLELQVSETMNLSSSLKYQLFIIRSLGEGIYVCKNNMPYAPKKGYEAGIAINAAYCHARHSIPFYLRTSQSNFSRVWLKLDGKKNRKVKINYSYNSKGERYLGCDNIHDKVDVYARIPHTSPIQTDWWGYWDNDKYFLLVTEHRIEELMFVRLG